MKGPHRSVEEMIQGLPKAEQVIVNRLRNLILECLPGATEQIYDDWGAPFYRHHRLICFVWPPSALTCPTEKYKSQQAKGVTLGFSQGHLMANEDGTLLAEGRKQVHCMYFRSVKEINENQIRALLFEADLVDQRFAKKKKAKKKKSTT